MTEEEWMRGDDVMRMLADITGNARDRKLRLFGCACSRQVGSLPDERSRRAVEVAELFAEGLIGHDALEAARIDARAAVRFVAGLSYGSSYERTVAKEAAEAVANLTGKKIGKVIGAVIMALVTSTSEASGLIGARAGAYATHRHAQWRASLALCAAILVDIFGNPFRPITFDPAWRTTDVMLLAQGIYDERAFDRMPILADALQDAGCANEDILSHCRDEKATHVRGCWVVDLVLGKQ